MNQYHTLPLNSSLAEVDGTTGEHTWWMLDGIKDGRIVCYTPHRHETLELIYVIKGCIRAETAGASYPLNGGELMIVNPFEEHGADYMKNDGYLRYISLQIEMSFLMPAFDGELRSCMTALLDGRAHFTGHIVPNGTTEHDAAIERVYKLMDGILALRSKKDAAAADDCIQMSMAYELLGCIIENFYNPTPAAAGVSRDLHFIRIVTRYLEDHYTEKLSTSTVSDALSYNLNHFCRVFKSCFGVTFMNYLTEYRIFKVLHLYPHSTLLPTEMAAKVGFSDYGTFARAFKQYTSITPSVYFKL
nr:helix-turn-helix transcriptional regulator [Clostridia bacterium]